MPEKVTLRCSVFLFSNNLLVTFTFCTISKKKKHTLCQMVKPPYSKVCSTYVNNQIFNTIASLLANLTNVFISRTTLMLNVAYSWRSSCKVATPAIEKNSHILSMHQSLSTIAASHVRSVVSYATQSTDETGNSWVSGADHGAYPWPY